MPSIPRAAARKTSPRAAAKKAAPARKPAAAAPARAVPPAKAKFEAPAPAAAPAKAVKAAKPDKPVKATKLRVALVRDGFTMPQNDFALIATLKARALAGQREAKKSELLRAGLHALAALDGAALVQALNRLEPIKTGRPKKNH